MALDVLGDDVDGLALILSRPARGAARAKVGGEGLDGLGREDPSVGAGVAAFQRYLSRKQRTYQAARARVMRVLGRE
jgi:hypothetical protein